MPTLKAVDPAAATGKTKEVLDAFERQLTRVPSMIRLMANSPTTAAAYLQFNLAFEDAAILTFASSIVSRQGRVPHDEIERLRRIGFSDAEIVDVIGLVAVNIFRNYFNLVVDPDFDLPHIRTESAQVA